jgi:hypothetical protein
MKEMIEIEKELNVRLKNENEKYRNKVLNTEWTMTELNG